MKYWTVAVSLKSGNAFIEHLPSVSSVDAIRDTIFRRYYSLGKEDITSIKINQISFQVYDELSNV